MPRSPTPPTLSCSQRLGKCVQDPRPPLAAAWVKEDSPSSWIQFAPRVPWGCSLTPPGERKNKYQEVKLMELSGGCSRSAEGRLPLRLFSLSPLEFDRGSWGGV